MFFRPPRKRILPENSPKETRESPDKPAQMREYARLTSLGFEFTLSVGLLAWLGWLLDGWTGLADTFPVFLLFGVFLGLGLGIYRLQLKLGRPPRDESSSKDSEA